MDFYTSFEKRAEGEKDKSPGKPISKKEKAMWAAGMVGAPIAANTVAYKGLMPLGSLLDPNMDSFETGRLHKKITKAKGLKTDLSYRMPGVKGEVGAYSSASNRVHLPRNRRKAGMLAHELGHASNLGRGKVKPGAFAISKFFEEVAKDVPLKDLVGKKSIKTKGKMAFNLLRNYPALGAASLSRSGNLPAALVATPLAALSGNENLERAAPFIAPAVSAPMIADEVMASLRGAKDVFKHKGAMRGIRAIPGLIGALSTYASIPAASYYISKRYLAKKKGKEQ